MGTDRGQGGQRGREVEDVMGRVLSVQQLHYFREQFAAIDFIWKRFCCHLVWASGDLH